MYSTLAAILPATQIIRRRCDLAVFSGSLLSETNEIYHRACPRKIALFYWLSIACLSLFADQLFSQDLSTKQEPFRVTGSAQIRYSAYRSDRLAFPANAVYLTAAPTIYVYGVAIPLQLSLSNVGVAFRQPFNRFSLRPRYKWAEAQLGWVNPRYSEFTMAGYTMLGAGIRLTPGRWDLAGSYGRLNRATTLDTLAGELNPESFDRFGYALYLGYGSERAKVFATYLSAQDRPESLRFAEAVGRPQFLDVEPAANTAASLGFELPFGKTITFEAEAAISIFTENRTLNGLSIDSVIVEAGVPSWITRLLDANASTDIYPALRSQIEYKSPGPMGVTVSLAYRRIAPNYRTMGAFFFQNDLENFLLAGGLKPWKQLRLHGSLGRQHDNLNGIKAATSTRIIGSARADLHVKAFGISLDFYNYSNDQTPRIARVGDSLRIASTNRSLSLSPSYTLQGDRTIHIVAATLSRSSVRDFIGGFAQGAAFRDLNTDLLTLTYSVTALPTSTTVGITGTYTSLGNAGNTPDQIGGYRSTGINLSIAQAFSKSKGSVSVNGGVFGQSNLNSSSGQAPLATAGLSASYRAGKRVRLNTSFQYSGGPATGRLAAPDKRFNDFRVDTRLSYRL